MGIGVNNRQNGRLTASKSLANLASHNLDESVLVLGSAGISVKHVELKWLANLANLIEFVCMQVSDYI